MCLICAQYELGKMTKDQALRNLREYSPDKKHTEEVLEKLDLENSNYKIVKQLEEMLRDTNEGS